MGSTSELYAQMLYNFLHPQLRSLQVNMEEMWFQQDGATAHMARASMTVVQQMFPQHVVSRFGNVPWPPCSPDLSACDFFLWGYLKSKVYVRKPRTVDDLKVSIHEEIATVPQGMLVNVMQNFEERLQTCVRQEGRHLSDIIFHKWVIKTVFITGCFGVDINFYTENKQSYNYLKNMRSFCATLYNNFLFSNP
jgi:hypothetical protein